VTRYMWVTARKAEGFPTTMACTAAEVSRQAFYDWLARQAAKPPGRPRLSKPRPAWSPRSVRSTPSSTTPTGRRV
jgi:hypothetical protein